MRGCILLLFLYSSGLHAQMMDIGIQRDLTVSSFRFKIYSPVRIVLADSVVIRNVNKANTCSVSKVGHTIRLTIDNQPIDVQGEVKFLLENGDYFGIIPLGYNRKERTYEGNLKVSIDSEGLRLVNQIELSDYLCGVVQAESGVNQNIEYYKVQAILARTYAIKNRDKHAKEGFMLTDLVNCQAYHGRCTHPDVIRKAVEETRGVVAVDNKLDLITAVYHSNSGGQTVNPEHVWNKPVEYLRSVVDTFSIGMPSYRWTKTFPVKEWLNYLERTFGYPVNDSISRQKALNYRQFFRQAFFVDPRYGIPLRDIRMDLKLKSTFFSVYHEGDQVVLKGRGFGHGVGMSQEGAMVMSKNGYSHEQILKFYFQGVRLIDMRTLFFYKDVPSGEYVSEG